MKVSSIPLFDLSSISLSLLCLLHCLALPVAVAFLPALSAWAGAEWLHVLFVAVAIPSTLLALHGSHRKRTSSTGIVILAGGGLLCLALGAAGWPAESLETVLTVAGSLLLAVAHLRNWWRHRARQGPSRQEPIG